MKIRLADKTKRIRDTSRGARRIDPEMMKCTADNHWPEIIDYLLLYSLIKRYSYLDTISGQYRNPYHQGPGGKYVREAITVFYAYHPGRDN